MAPTSLEGGFQIFFLPKSEFDFFIYFICMNPLVITREVPLPSNLVQSVSSRVTELKINCLLDFIPVIFHWAWFGMVTQRECLLVVLAIGFQETDVERIVDVTEVKVAAEVESVIVAVLVNLCNWERSLLSWLHLLDIR